jgi:hypothetical protein
MPFFVKREDTAGRVSCQRRESSSWNWGLFTLSRAWWGIDLWQEIMVTCNQRENWLLRRLRGTTAAILLNAKCRTLEGF